MDSSQTVHTNRPRFKIAEKQKLKAEKAKKELISYQSANYLRHTTLYAYRFGSEFEVSNDLMSNCPRLN